MEAKMSIYRFTRLFVVLSAGGLLAIALMWGLFASGTHADSLNMPASAIRYVSPLGNDASNDCTNSQAPCRTVQHAVTRAQAGDEVRVARGTYTGTMTTPSSTGVYSATVVLAKNLTALLGGYSLDFSVRDPQANETILSASDAPRKFVVFLSEVDTLVDGFTMTGATGACPTDCAVVQYGGGAMWIRGGAPTISHNRIENNRAYYYGGGIYVSRSASPTIAHNVIASNIASFHEDGGGIGGGISVRSASATITGNTILSNKADVRGGGIDIENGIVSLTANTIGHNQVISPTNGRGAGVHTSGEMLVTISHNDVFSNSLPGGGGSGLEFNGPAVVDSNYIHHNRVATWGGAVLIGNHEQPVTVTNNVVADNVGGSAIWASNYGDVSIINNSVARNTGDGLLLYVQWARPATASARVINNILASNGECGLGAYAGGGTGLNLTIDFNDVWGNNKGAFCSLANPPSGSHNINADPQFVNPTQGDYHIHLGSPAMDAGTNAGAPTYDKDGVARPQGRGVDMGAYEIVEPHLAINYSNGSPGSYFTLTGTNFPPSSTGTVSINGHAMTETIPVDVAGGFVFRLNTTGADEGRYFVTVSVNPSATSSFMLDGTAPFRRPEGSGPVIAVPAGIAYTKFVYLPIIRR